MATFWQDQEMKHNLKAVWKKIQAKNQTVGESESEEIDLSL